MTRRPLSLNRRRKRVASEECSESPAVATGSKKPQKSAAALPEERFSFDIGEDDMETFKKGKCPCTYDDDTCQSSSGDIVEIKGQKDKMGGKCSSNSIVPLLNASNTNIPNIVITGCNFTNCNVSLCSNLTIMRRPLVLLTKPVLMSC